LALLAAVALACPTAGGAGVESILHVFSARPSLPPELERALDAYTAGRWFAALEALAGAERTAPESHRDDLDLVRGSILAELGWHADAARSFAAVLDGPGPGPYYPLALLRLVEEHRADGRLGAVSRDLARYLEDPWRLDDDRGRRVRELFAAYGDLREEGPRTALERERLAGRRTWRRQGVLERDRPSERLLYLGALDLLRSRLYDRSFVLLDRIAVTSPYHPFALHTAAQDLYAAGRRADAEHRIGELLELPPATAGEAMLADHARLALGQMRFEAGDAESALRVATSLRASPAYGAEARLFAGEVHLARGQPSLAAAYLADPGAGALPIALEAARGLGLGSAYRALGSRASAADAVRRSRDRVRAARLRLQAGAASETARLRRIGERLLRASAEARARARERLARGLRRLAAGDRPFDLWGVLRLVTMSHEHSVLGREANDLELLTVIEPAAPTAEARSDALWEELLASERRRPIEEALCSRFERIPAAGQRDREAGLRLLDVHLRWLAGSMGRAFDESPAGVAEQVNALARELWPEAGRPPLFDPKSPPPSQVGLYRAAVVAPAAKRQVPSASAIDAARASAVRLTEQAVDRGLAALIRDRLAALAHIEYDLDLALSETLAAKAGAAGAALR
jgi:hypothetical protein